MQKGGIAFGPMQASADGELCEGRLLVDRPPFPGESCVESFWSWLMGVESPITLICLYSLFLSAQHIACLIASALLVSASPLHCYLNAADLINLVLSICDITNARTHTHSYRGFRRCHTACWNLPRMETDGVPRPRFSFVCCQRFLCVNSLSLDAVSTYKVVLTRIDSVTRMLLE